MRIYLVACCIIRKNTQTLSTCAIIVLQYCMMTAIVLQNWYWCTPEILHVSEQWLQQMEKLHSNSVKFPSHDCSVTQVCGGLTSCGDSSPKKSWNKRKQPCSEYLLVCKINTYIDRILLYNKIHGTCCLVRQKIDHPQLKLLYCHKLCMLSRSKRERWFEIKNKITVTYCEVL